MQTLPNFLVLGDAWGVSGDDWKRTKKKPVRDHRNKIMHSTNVLEHALIILKCVVHDHRFINLVSLVRISALPNFESWQIIVRVSGIRLSTPHAVNEVISAWITNLYSWGSWSPGGSGILIYHLPPEDEEKARGGMGSWGGRCGPTTPKSSSPSSTRTNQTQEAASDLQ